MTPYRVGRSQHNRMLAAMAIMVIAAVLPMFFDVYRSVYFVTVSFDDYSHYLLWLLGLPGAEIPPSPHVYRLGSVVAAAPFYHLPLVKFSGEGIFRAPVETPLEYAKALQAMCAANIFYGSVAAIVAGTYLALRRNVPVGWAFAATLASLLLTRYFAMNSADGIALLPLMIAMIGIIERKVAILVPAVILGTIVNEKVALVAFLVLALRFVFVPEHRRVHLALLLIAGFALAAYAVTVLTLALPGLDNQRDPGTYLNSIADSLHHLTGMKGLYQNIWPCLFIVLLWLVSIVRTEKHSIVYNIDIGAVALLFVFALALDVDYNVGRIVMFSMPLFFLGAIDGIARLGGDARNTTTSADPFSGLIMETPPRGGDDGSRYPQAAC
jgi:hypothetical protein